MKKTGSLNREISSAIAGLGHSDLLVVVDAGYPLPSDVACIDIALRPNLPRLLDVVETIISELEVESYIIADEIEDHNDPILKGLQSLLPSITARRVPHSEFKALSASAKTVVRTGEFTPFGNVILVAGVAF